MQTTEILTPASTTVTFQVLSWSRFTPAHQPRATIFKTTIPADADPVAVITARWPHASGYRLDAKLLGPWLPLQAV
jgi:hypothetical protein